MAHDLNLIYIYTIEYMTVKSDRRGVIPVIVCKFEQKFSFLYIIIFFKNAVSNDIAFTHLATFQSLSVTMNFV